MAIRKKDISVLLLVVCGFLGLADSVKASPGVSITIYNDNFGVVRDVRQLSFDAGVNTMKFTDVASAIDPTSVSFKCLDTPDFVRILEQNYEYDLVNTSSLLQRYIDKDVSLIVKGAGSDRSKMLRGKLSAYIGNDLIVEQVDGGLTIVARDSIESISLEEKPEDLVTKPTLVWLANAATAADKECQITYTTGSINWKADYTAILNGDDTALDFNGWVTIDNRSGAAYKDAKIKLIAGDVRRVNEAPQVRYKSSMARAMVLEAADSAAGFEEKSFMEYHMYTLGRPSTVGNNQTKQIEFVEPVKDVPAEKVFVYETGTNYYWSDPSRKGKVQIKIQFDNKEESKLGIALPKGKVRTFKMDPADGSLEFVGEDTIDHTAKKEEISLYIGNAFDLVVEDNIVDQKNGRSWRTVTRELKLKNTKKEDAIINVDQKITRYHNWEIDSAKVNGQEIQYKKTDAGTARFAVKVPADTEVVLNYKFTETW